MYQQNRNLNHMRQMDHSKANQYLHRKCSLSQMCNYEDSSNR